MRHLVVRQLWCSYTLRLADAVPWTAELCMDRMSREALYEPGEKDD
jgi:hypothetical protein